MDTWTQFFINLCISESLFELLEHPWFTGVGQRELQHHIAKLRGCIDELIDDFLHSMTHVETVVSFPINLHIDRQWKLQFAFARELKYRCSGLSK